ncbi:uncharacterized protein L201_000437 [Kwoniella dendrophila CBS 6074]|uniref:Uncharacterized protein n=1 Tax=Kwoniella dendrophila CBS 6074 TaxID=1295534 RepID=A0AAX4JMF0_9TREE
MCSPSTAPPPYSQHHPILPHSSSSNTINPNDAVGDSRSIRIPLLPILPPYQADQHFFPTCRTPRNIGRAMEDFQRTSSPSNWGRYRHGILIKPVEPNDKSKVFEWVSWFANLFSSSDDNTTHRRNYTGLGMSSVHQVHSPPY